MANNKEKVKRVTPTTVEIEPTFGYFGHWTSKDLKKYGFKLIKVSARATGRIIPSIHVTSTSIIKYGSVSVRARKTERLDLSNMIFTGAEYDKHAGAIIKDFPHLLYHIKFFEIENVEGDIIHIETGIKRSAKDRSPHLTLTSVNGAKFSTFKIEELMEFVGDLLYTTCEYRPPVKGIRAYRCHASDELEETMFKENLNQLEKAKKKPKVKRITRKK